MEGKKGSEERCLCARVPQWYKPSRFGGGCALRCLTGLLAQNGENDCSRNITLLAGVFVRTLGLLAPYVLLLVVFTRTGSSVSSTKCC